MRRRSHILLMLLLFASYATGFTHTLHLVYAHHEHAAQGGCCGYDHHRGKSGDHDHHVGQGHCDGGALCKISASDYTDSHLHYASGVSACPVCQSWYNSGASADEIAALVINQPAPVENICNFAEHIYRQQICLIILPRGPPAV